VPFEIIGDIVEIETIATGGSIRELARLQRLYGRGRWRKLKWLLSSVCGVERSVARNSTGMRRTESAGRRSSASDMSTRSRKTSRRSPAKFAVCIENSEH